MDAGVAAPLIDAQDKLADVDRKFPTVLTVGSMGDGEFAGRIRDCLLAAQIPCWSIEADDETRLQSHEIILDHSVYFDCLVLLGTQASLESPQTRRYMSQLAGGKGSRSGKNITTLAACDLFDLRGDELCAVLKQSVVVDFQGWENAGVFEAAGASLVSVLSRPGS
ncbi:MAG TPA: hypothetical protein EYM38_00560 [Dehalococcoidia bacterium]|nr:hypothetical protein [Dehalococcoidia bacterium]